MQRNTEVLTVKTKDMTGERYGRLTVLKHMGTKNKNVQIFRYYSESSFSHINKNSKIFDINFWYDNIKELKMDKFLENTYFDSKLCVRRSFDNL